MTLSFVPVLHVQRALHDLPRGKERFAEYLRVMCNDARDGLRLPPLSIINPMAREPVTAALDALLAHDADGLAARVTEGMDIALANVPGGAYRVALVVADDAGGGWTNRYSWEFARRFEPLPAAQRGWLTGVLWSGEPPTADAAREAVRIAISRKAYIQRHGTARTLRERLAQEGTVLAIAAATGPTLDAEEIAYTRALIAPHLDSNDLPTSMTYLFGDPAAVSLGYTPAGLSHWAGLALALHDARAPFFPGSAGG